MDQTNLVSSVHRLLMENLPVKTGRSPSGWHTFNCVMCSDNRKRAGIKITGAKISYHCFNCKFKTGWAPPGTVSKKYRELASRLGASDNSIKKVVFDLFSNGELLKDLSDSVTETVYDLRKFETVPLPEGAEMVEHLPTDDPVRRYADSRGLTGLYPFLKFSDDDPKYHNRLIIPYVFDGELVGWSGRDITGKSKSRYLSMRPQNFIFNIDPFISEQRKIMVVCEGELDAAKLDCVALMGSNITAEQAYFIETMKKRVILCPDPDKPGKALVDKALALGWEVSFPPWLKQGFDVDDAINKYGRLLTLRSIVKYATSNSVEISVRKKLI